MLSNIKIKLATVNGILIAINATLIYLTVLAIS